MSKKRPVLVSELAKAAKEAGGSAPKPHARPGAAPTSAPGAYRFVSDNLRSTPHQRPPRGRRLNLVRMVKGALRSLRETARGVHERGILGSTRDFAEKSVACLFARLSARI